MPDAPSVDFAPRSRALYERACRVMPGGNTRTTVFYDPFPLYLVQGAGCRVTDADGRVYLDVINNFTAMIHGHAHPAVTAAAAAQIARGTAFGAPTPAEIELAELLVDRIASVEQIRFTNSGTEAVMTAVKAARAFTGRSRILKIEGAYHGSYDLVEVSLDTPPERWTSPAPSVAYVRGTPQSMLDEVIVVPMNDLAAARTAFALYGETIAAVLIDPMPNRAGLVPAGMAFLDGLATLAHAHGALTVLDEVITLRLGHGGAQGRLGLRPDLTAMGKIIGGGFAVGALGGRADVMAVFDPRGRRPVLPHGGTFSANPVTMSAGLAAMTLLTPESFARLDVMGERVKAAVNASFMRTGLPGRCVGCGSLLKVHFSAEAGDDYRGAYADPTARARLAAFHRGLLERGVMIAAYGLMALSTPMTDADIDILIEAVDATLTAIAD
ncbi:glutamate-1-semialdehyde aminotransferase [Ameyamaea chiangmaiensis NBRC 103196]|uniref:Aspartate aminotransferase family protein n=1 Tax=Ameyamaea chiangmaiensis TaxID=442969 RepID=A0A850P7Q5_9PROT|nr:aspartate aminotransferase family protein [Ameyamaea chiangmaiensis]MBS4074153.1 aspartate aminotransferase family protein [Ameyamaea chiangmaiensis]NVN39964.1 aspartate aminotransferase family protein [Ameyamaea chiangmaiensis]GBQ71057.1 glutamate-1-semialdehyde aminotransferase [Ameyamaea chiangmaiensis NBRC 103196]